MKKFYSCILFFIVCISSIKASVDNELPLIDLQYHYSSVTNGVSVQRPRVPAKSPSVYQDGHILIFEVEDFCNSVTIVDIETDEVVYETMVFDFETQIVLPQYLEGEYEIRFNRVSYYFSGIILL